jgi:uncharacterized protein (DUF885 family)
MRHRLLSALAFALTILIWLLCGATVNCESATLSFRETVKQFVESEMELYPEVATAWGDHRYDAKVSDLSAQGIKARIRHANEWKLRFGSIESSVLSAQDEADRQWLIARCDGELLWNEQVRDYQKDPDLYLPTAAVYQLIQRGFAPLERRMELVTAREIAWLPNLAAARQNLLPEATAKVALEITLDQMAGTLHFFADDLPAAFASVADSTSKNAFVEASKKTRAAISSYERWLRFTLQPACSGSFAIGADAYRRMLADDDMVDTPLHRLEQIGVDQLAHLQSNFRAVAASIDPKRPAVEVLRALNGAHPQASQVISLATAGLADLRTFVLAHHLATIPSTVMPIVAETPPFARATTFASMDTPGPFEHATEAYFYVSLPDPSWPPEKQDQLLTFFSPPTLSDVSTHEVFPGHYVQFLNNRLNPDEVRSLYDSGSNAEGWAFYCEQMMLDEGLHAGEPEFRLAQIQMALTRACRYLVSIRMHTQGMTVAQAADFFEKEAFMTPHNAMVEARRGTDDPGYLRYQLGKLEILKLRDDLQRKQGSSFELGKFHDAFLAQGAVPIKLIRRAMLGSDGPLF